MTRDDLHRALPDYLDGRMSGAERASFEAAVARDPKLSEQLEFHRTVGRALRSPMEGPRPGFAARARARFEAADRRSTGWGRILRWEAAGLVAAGVLLALLILPTRWEGIPLSPVAQAPAPPTAERVDDQLARERDAVAPASKPMPAPAPPARSVPAAVAKVAAGDAELTADARQEEKKNEGYGDEAAAGAGAAALSAARAPSPAEPSMRMKARADSGFVGRSVPLPQGSVEAGSVERIPVVGLDTSKDVTAPVRNAIIELHPARGREDVVLIGPRSTPMSCEGYRIEISPPSLRIILTSPSSGRPAAPGGCAVVVPSSPLPVVVEDPVDEP